MPIFTIWKFPNPVSCQPFCFFATSDNRRVTVTSDNVMTTVSVKQCLSIVNVNINIKGRPVKVKCFNGGAANAGNYNIKGKGAMLSDFLLY